MWDSWKDSQGVHESLKIMHIFMCLDPLLPQMLFFLHSLKGIHVLKVFRERKKEQEGRKASKQTLLGFSVLLIQISVPVAKTQKIKTKRNKKGEEWDGVLIQMEEKNMFIGLGYQVTSERWNIHPYPTLHKRKLEIYSEYFAFLGRMGISQEKHLCTTRDKPSVVKIH